MLLMNQYSKHSPLGAKQDPTISHDDDQGSVMSLPYVTKSVSHFNEEESPQRAGIPNLQSNTVQEIFKSPSELPNQQSEPRMSTHHSDSNVQQTNSMNSHRPTHMQPNSSEQKSQE